MAFEIAPHSEHVWSCGSISALQLGQNLLMRWRRHSLVCGSSHQSLLSFRVTHTPFCMRQGSEISWHAGQFARSTGIP